MPSLIVKTPPAVEPIGLAEAKSHLRVDIADDDTLIQNLIKAARQNLEQTFDIAFITQSLVLGRDYFPAVFGMGWGWSPGWWLGSTWMSQYDSQELRYGYINLRPPVQSVTSVTYLDQAGATQTWASSNYLLDGDSRPARLGLNLGKTYPTTGPLLGAVKIETVAGYGADGSFVPDNYKAALKLYLGHLYQNREEVLVGTRLVTLQLPLGVEALMAPAAPVLLR